jgi:dTDP-glucose 4,6-dehydratase
MHAETNEPVNIGNPAEMTIAQIAREIIDATGSSSSLTYQPLPVDDPKVRQPDVTRARERLGWDAARGAARRVGVPIQPVDATVSPSISAGVR